MSLHIQRTKLFKQLPWCCMCGLRTTTLAHCPGAHKIRVQARGIPMLPYGGSLRFDRELVKNDRELVIVVPHGIHQGTTPIKKFKLSSWKLKCKVGPDLDARNMAKEMFWRLRVVVSPMSHSSIWRPYSFTMHRVNILSYIF